MGDIYVTLAVTWTILIFCFITLFATVDGIGLRLRRIVPARKAKMPTPAEVLESLRTARESYERSQFTLMTHWEQKYAKEMGIPLYAVDKGQPVYQLPSGRAKGTIVPNSIEVLDANYEKVEIPSDLHKALNRMIDSEYDSASSKFAMLEQLYDRKMLSMEEFHTYTSRVSKRTTHPTNYRVR